MEFHDLTFLYLIFQANPKKDVVYYWVDGEKSRKLMSMDNFIKLSIHKQPSVFSALKTACTNYSFHLWSIKDEKIIDLKPTSQVDEMYRDPVTQVINERVNNKNKKQDKKKYVTLQDQLIQLGFNPPSENSTQNLIVALSDETRDSPGMFSRMFRKFSRK